MTNNIFLTVIVPCYNEAENLKRGVLSDINSFLKTKKFSWEVIVSNDGSTDNSAQIVKDQLRKLPNFRFLDNPHGGKPSALNYGIVNAKGKYILFTDTDQSTPISELDKLLDRINDPKIGAVIGSRGLVRKNFPVYRKMGAIAFSFIRRALILPEIIDTQCGFKLFPAEVLKKYFPKLEFFRNKEKVVGWKVTSWDVEFLHILKKNGYKISEATVIWNDKDVSKSKGGALEKYIKESKEMFSQIIRIRINDWRGVYGNESGK